MHVHDDKPMIKIFYSTLHNGMNLRTILLLLVLLLGLLFRNGEICASNAKTSRGMGESTVIVCQKRGQPY